MRPKTESELAEIAKAQAEELAQMNLSPRLIMQAEFAFTKPVAKQREFCWSDLDQ